MKILLIAISMVLILGEPVFAGSSRNISYQGSSSGPITTTNVVINTRGTNIYNLTLNSTATLATLTVYDSPSTPVLETPIYEVEVAVAGDSRSVDFSTSPIQTTNGLVASVTNGVAYLNVEK